MKCIAITPELRDYIEKLHYESFAYHDLLNTVSRDICEMTDEEWEDSLNYFQVLSEEADLRYKFAKETIVDMYKEEIGENKWHINFRDCELRIGTCYSETKNNKFLQYHEYINNLYKDEYAKENPFDFYKNGVKTITFQVTNQCNMACSYCYQHGKNDNNMTFEIAKQFIDMILTSNENIKNYINYSQCEGIVLDFIGGEPWLAIDTISQITNYFIGQVFKLKHPWAIKYKISIASNGLLHFTDKVQNYIKKHKQHLSYGISIDGNKELHDSCRIDLESKGTYDRAIAAVKDYNQNYQKIESKMTIAPENVDKIYDAIKDMVENIGYTNINLNCVYEEGWTNKHANILYWELHKIVDWLITNNLQDKIHISMFSDYIGKPNLDDKNWCGGVGLMISIDNQGNIYPCQRYSNVSINNKQKPYIIGNLNNGVGILPEHKQRIEELKSITRSSQSSEECNNCPIATGCSWCSAYNYEIFGTPNKRATFICCMHKARVLANIYYQKKCDKKSTINFPEEWAIDIIGQKEWNNLKSM